MSESQFSTGFFRWYLRTYIWVAADPIHEGIRWVIRKDESIIKNKKYELLYVKEGKPNYVNNADDVRHLGWLAVSHRIKQIADMVFLVPDLMPPELVSKGFELFEDISKNGAWNVEEVAPGTGQNTNVGQGQSEEGTGNPV